ncbi:MAG TPA: efflux RND transporter permease subunit, partial [Spirochaetota bacterium]|nr:efflux RND transporter permease subunit [Spirochaetota bacterium]
LAIPFSINGMVFAVLSHNMTLSYMALFGLVGLCGVVVNDSLVMVSFIDRTRERYPDKPLRQIIVEGAATRLRPVILTTLTTIAGLLPTAYGFGGIDQLIRPTTIVMAWGLLFSTSLILTVVPAFYMLVENLPLVFTKN